MFIPFIQLLKSIPLDIPVREYLSSFGKLFDISNISIAVSNARR